MQPRLSLITLGVADVARARKFYEALGFKAGRASQDSVTFFDAGGVDLALFGRASLAEDANVADSTPDLTFSASPLAHNTRSEAEVDKALAEAVAAGAKLIKGRRTSGAVIPVTSPILTGTLGGGAQSLFHAAARRPLRPRHVS